MWTLWYSEYAKIKIDKCDKREFLFEKAKCEKISYTLNKMDKKTAIYTLGKMGKMGKNLAIHTLGQMEFRLKFTKLATKFMPWQNCLIRSQKMDKFSSFLQKKGQAYTR